MKPSRGDLFLFGGARFSLFHESKNMAKECWDDLLFCQVFGGICGLNPHMSNHYENFADLRKGIEPAEGSLKIIEFIEPY